jgi:hypothetical protein
VRVTVMVAVPPFPPRRIGRAESQDAGVMLSSMMVSGSRRQRAQRRAERNNLAAEGEIVAVRGLDNARLAFRLPVMFVLLIDVRHKPKHPGGGWNRVVVA